jgi:hypothetical protein
MPRRTGFVNDVQKNPRHPKRYDVHLEGPVPVYTLSKFAANLCQRALQHKRAVTMQTSETQYGELIDAVDFVDVDANGEVIPACVGRRHWWYLIRPNVYRCKHCENHGKSVIKYQPGGWGGHR